MTVITYRTLSGNCVGPWRATLCAECAAKRTDLADVQHGRHDGTCDDCDDRAYWDERARELDELDQIPEPPRW